MKLNKNVIIPVSAGIASFGVGFATGYFVHKKRNTTPTEHIVIQAKESEEKPEDQLSMDFERVINEKSKSAHPANQGLEETKVEEVPKSTPLALVEPPEEPNMVNVFTNEDSDWNYEVEIASRNPEKPYIIHRDEFYEDNDIYDESSLMYYQGDNILVDSNEVPIYNYEEIIGENNLRFGHGSHDISIVYIRNEPHKAQYEVIIDHGYYAVEVLGAEIEDQMANKDLKHSNTPLKFRD